MKIFKNLLRFAAPGFPAVLFAACVFSDPPANPGEGWTARNAGTDDILGNIAGDGERIVVVGTLGARSVSTDGGLHWEGGSTGVPSQSGSALQASMGDIAFGAEVFVAVGGNGTIATSPDGLAWTERLTGLKRVLAVGEVGGVDLHGVARGAGRFVAVGGWGHVLASPDGVAWSVVARRDTLHHLWDVVWTGDSFVAAGSGDSLFTSPDGLAWTRRPNPTNTRPMSLAFGDGRLVMLEQQGDFAALALPAWESTYPSSARNFISCTEATAATWAGDRWVLIGPTFSCVLPGWDKAPRIKGAFKGVVPGDLFWTGKRLIAVSDKGLYTSP